jgi:hypothetical protein
MENLFLLLMIGEDGEEVIPFFDAILASDKFDELVEAESWDTIVLAKATPGVAIGFDRDFDLYGGEEIRRHDFPDYHEEE